jgi:hypothetical protein
LQVAFGFKDIKDFPHLKKKNFTLLPDGRKIGSRWNNIDVFYANF